MWFANQQEIYILVIFQESTIKPISVEDGTWSGVNVTILAGKITFGKRKFNVFYTEGMGCF